MFKCFLMILLSLASSLNAGVIKSRALYFKETGKIGNFKWAPASYKSDFRYDIYYYIPKSLKDGQSAKSLIFLHGGGRSTLTPEGSVIKVKNYLNSSLINTAEKLQTVLVLPSGTGLNWGGHTSGMIRNLARLMRLELELDHNNMGLSGHSMGGMGIGRNFTWLADEFAYFFPTSSGIDPNLQTEENLNKVFNVPYVHMQGIYDKFSEFVTRTELQFSKTRLLEAKYQQSSKFKLLIYDGGHDYKQDAYREVLESLQKNPRNIFQKKLYVSFYHYNSFHIENNIKFYRGPLGRYFWVEMLPSAGASERLDFIVEAAGNRINLKITKIPKNISGIRLNLSKKMFNPKQEIEVSVNDIFILKRMMKNSPRLNLYDPTFKFDDSINLYFKN